MRKAFIGAIWLGLSIIGWVVWEVLKDAVAGWINKHLQLRWQMTDPAIQDYLLFTWLPPIVLIAAFAAALWFVYRLGARAVTTSNAPVIHDMPAVETLPLGAAALTPNLLILHDKLRDTEWWPSGDGFNVKFRVLNDSDVLAKKISSQIRTLEFLQEGKWRTYGHDYAEVPLATRDGKAEFDLRGGEEETVYIARRSVKRGERIQLCYARDGIPNTIPLKPAWRVGIRLVSDNAPRKDAVFELRVSSDESLVGTLLGDGMADELAQPKPQKAARIAHNDIEIADAPTYWSLSETLSWIAFGEAITARQWGEKVRADGLYIRPEEETEGVNKAEQELFEKLRGKEITALGKKDHSELYEEIPAEYFLSDVECKILHDQIDVSSKNIGVMQRWSGPKWRDVRFKRENVLHLWPQNRKGK